MYHRYTSSSKQSSFRSAFPLTNEQILQRAPSVMAAEAHESRGERYAFVPTLAVIACGCNHLIHEPDIGWEKWPHDLTEKAISPRGVASLRVFEKMASTLEDFARTC